MLPTLYGYATNGSIKQWEITVEGDTFITSHGKKGGKQTTKSTKVKGKNVGRANETTPEEQAIKEAKAKWVKQIDKGYAEHIEDAGQLLNPMLAHDYLKQGHRITYPAYAQPKLDGVRCLIYKDESGKIVFKSRGGKDYPVIERIAEAVEPLLEDGLILDGELYCHGMSLQDIVSAVKKPNDNTCKISFWCFDLAMEKVTWQVRRVNLKAFSSEHHVEGTLYFLEDNKVNSDEELKELHGLAILKGFEGIMVRNRTGFYKFNHRSPDLQKYKEFLDGEFTIVGNETDKDGGVIWIVEVPTEGLPCLCKVRPKGTMEQRMLWNLTAGSYYGKLLKVKYQTKTDDGNLQFPIGIELDRTDS